MLVKVPTDSGFFSENHFAKVSLKSNFSIFQLKRQGRNSKKAADEQIDLKEKGE